jgi:voltage-gated potassium channel Kch
MTKPPPNPRLVEVGRKARDMRPQGLLERRMSRLLREPPSIRLAASVIVTVTTLLVVGSGILMRVLDHKEYPDIWVGMWWALQTVTTVGYGDVTPKNVTGRLVAAIVMLEGIAFLAIITAAITSTFVARAERERAVVEGREEATYSQQFQARFDELDKRLDRLEAMLDKYAKP